MFEVLQNIPVSTVFIFSLAASISLLTSLVNRILSNPKKTKTMRKEVAEWNSELRKAQKAGDKKAVDKLMKKQKAIMQLQSKMMWQSLKVTLIFFVPLLIIWQVLGGFYTAPPQPPVANISRPMNVSYFPGFGPVLPLPIFNISLIWWYLLCSLFFGTVFSHVLGLVEVE
jgi:uncharacterized membrane protein (DUF106 family)